MAEEAKINLSIDTGSSPQTLGQLEDKVASLNEQLRDVKIGSQEYKNLQQELVQTTRQFKNLELGMEALDNEQVAGELGSVAGAVGDVTAAVVLLGGENENLEAMVANIEKGIGISMAFKGAIEGLSSAWKLLNNVMRANPIGLVITAVALLIAGIVALVVNWEKLTDVFTKSGKKLKELTDFMGKNRDLILALLGPLGWLALAYIKVIDLIEDMKSDTEKAVEREERLRRAQGKAATKRHKQRVEEIEEEQELRRKAFNDSQEIFDLEIDRMEAEGKNADALKKAKIEATLEEKEAELSTIRDLLESWTQYYTDLFRISGKSKEDFLAQMKGQGIDLVALQEEANERILKAEQEIFAAETELIKFNREVKEKAIKDEVEDEEEKNIAIENLRKKHLDNLKKLEDRKLKADQERRKIEISMIEDEFDKAEELLLFQHEQSIANLDARIQEENDLIVAKEIELQAKLDELDEKRRKKKEEKEKEHMEVLKNGAQDLFNAANSLAQHLSDRDLKRAQEKTARGEKLTASEIKRLKRQDKINKAFALAQIAADTARGIAGAIAAGAGVPFPFNLGAIASGVAAVLAGSVQAAQVLGESVEIPSPADIAGETETAGAEAGEVPNVEAAAFGSTLLNTPQMVVVVEDINNGQQSVSAIEAQASFN